MQKKTDRKGKGIQLLQQLDALNETIGAKLPAIMPSYVARRQGLANKAITATLIRDAIERFERELKVILELE